MEKKTSIKDLKGKARIEYIWDYYKLPILVVICVIAFIIYTIVNFVTYKETALEIFMINTTNQNTEEIAASTDEFFQQEGLSGKDEEIFIDTSIFFSEYMGDSTNYYSNRSLTVKFAVGGGDILFAPDYVFNNYAGSGAMMPLTDVLTDDELEQYKDILVYTTEEESGETYPCGVALTDNKWLLTHHFYPEGETLYLGIGYNSKSPDTARDFFHYILTFEN